MLLFLNISAAIICAVAGAIAGNLWIEKLYREKNDILTFPHKISNQTQRRRQFLPPLLGMLFAYFLLSHTATIPDNMFNLIFIYFLVLFTITDFEQQVIFDVMQLPFALCGLVFCLVSGFPLLNHLTAALGGGVIFLVLAILTRGGIGGGDIKGCALAAVSKVIIRIAMPLWGQAWRLFWPDRYRRTSRCPRRR